MTYENPLRDLAPLALSLLAIVVFVVMASMAPADPGSVEPGPPVADAGPDLAMSAGEEALLDGGDSRDDSGIASMVWTVTDGSGEVTLTGARVSYVFSHPGTYAVVLRVTDVDGLSSTDVAVVTVS